MPGFWRDINEVCGLAGRRTAAEIEAESELGQQRRLPFDIAERPAAVAIERREQRAQPVVSLGMRLALGQRRLGHRRRRGEAGKACRVVDEARGVAAQQLAGEAAQMLGEPGLPGHREAVADLVDGAQLAPLPAAHEARMAAMAARQQLDDERGLAVAARRQHDRLLAPLHLPDRLLAFEIEAHRRVALAVLGPALGDADKEEEMDAPAQHALELGARLGADLLDLPPALAEHDRLLAVALHMHG